MKKALPLAVISLCLWVPTAEARPGTLDPSFGQRGQAAWPLSLGDDWRITPTAIDRLPRGGAIAQVGNRLIALDSDGTLRRGFSRDGFAHIRLPRYAPFGASLTLADLATDRDGRIVVVGTVTAPADPSRGWVKQDATVLVVRLTPYGNYDRTFGEQGFLLSDLGFRPPPIEPPPGQPMEPPAVTRAAGVAVDAKGRIVLSGVGIGRIGPCYPQEYYSFKDGFVARLQENGAPDLSFGQQGLAVIPDVRDVQRPLLTSSAATLLMKEPERECRDSRLQIARVGPQGQLDERFGQGLERFHSDSSLALDRRGRLLVSWPASQTSPPDQSGLTKSVSVGYLQRLRPDGEVDTSFGRMGTAMLRSPKGGFTPSQVLVDPKGMIVVAGAATPKQDRDDRGFFFLTRLSPDGGLDRHFGERGWARTKWGKEALVGKLSATFVKGGRLLIGGVLSDPGLKYDSGFGFARFLIR
jgi:uncharacterized delta-60 repeat protein